MGLDKDDTIKGREAENSRVVAICLKCGAEHNGYAIMNEKLGCEHEWDTPEKHKGLVFK